MSISETDDIWRLYRREWVTVHTLPDMVSDDASALFAVGMEWITGNLHGRVRHGDYRITLSTDNHNLFWGRVEVFKDNLKGEFKEHSAAEMHAKIHNYDEYTIVPRNSKSDHEIRSYGVKKL